MRVEGISSKCWFKTGTNNKIIVINYSISKSELLTKFASIADDVLCGRVVKVAASHTREGLSSSPGAGKLYLCFHL